MELPTSLDTPEFRESWEMWVAYRKEIKKKITPTTQKLQLKKLEKWGEKKAILAIELSIENGWVGLFEKELPPEPKKPVFFAAPPKPYGEDFTREQCVANISRLRELIKPIGRNL